MRAAREAERKLEALSELADYVKILIEPIDKKKGFIEIKDFGLLYEFLKEILGIDASFVIEKDGLEISAEELYKSAEKELKEYEKIKDKIDRIIDRLKIEKLEDIEKIDRKTRDELYTLVLKIKKLSPVYYKKSEWMQPFLELGDSEMLKLRESILAICEIKKAKNSFVVEMKDYEKNKKEVLKSVLAIMSKYPDFIIYDSGNLKIRARDFYEVVKKL